MTAEPAPTQRDAITTPGLAQLIWGWALDYGYVTHWTLRGLVAKTTPDQLLHPSGEMRPPVLLIPGVFENWRFLQPVAEHLYAAGHPVHLLDKLGYNIRALESMARIVCDYLQEHHLEDVTIVAHSKGGLIAKHALADPDILRRVNQLIAINSPFAGSRYAYFFLGPSVRMFTPTGPTIRQLMQQTAVNDHISSLYSVFDPHIPETSFLPGAENIVLPTIGHFRPLADPGTLDTISTILGRRLERVD